jgi:hypothetical protein
MGFYAGFIVDQNDMTVIAKQLHRQVPAAVVVDHFRHAWPGVKST